MFFWHTVYISIGEFECIWGYVKLIVCQQFRGKKILKVICLDEMLGVGGRFAPVGTIGFHPCSLHVKSCSG